MRRGGTIWEPTVDGLAEGVGDGLVQMPSGLIVSEAVAEQYVRQTHLPTAIDLFAGVGGFSLGFIEAGFRVVAAVDNDPACALTYMYNLGAYPCKFHFIEPKDEEGAEKVFMREFRYHEKTDPLAVSWVSGANRPARLPGVEHYWLGDIRKIKGKEILDALGMKRGEIDCVIGGPPCQGFSRANTRRTPFDPRNNLVFEFCRMVIEIQPKTMCMENVPGLVEMVTQDGVPVLDAISRILEDGGWSTYDALVRSLKAQAGSVGFLRHKGEGKKQHRRSKKRRSPQQSLKLISVGGNG